MPRSEEPSSAKHLHRIAAHPQNRLDGLLPSKRPVEQVSRQPFLGMCEGGVYADVSPDDLRNRTYRIHSLSADSIWGVRAGGKLLLPETAGPHQQEFSDFPWHREAGGNTHAYSFTGSICRESAHRRGYGGPAPDGRSNTYS